jgi:predicted metalloprotease
MRLDNEEESRNVEDRRGQGGGFRIPFPGGGQGLPTGGGRGGFGLITMLVLFGLAMLFGFDPRVILGGGGGGGGGFQIPMPSPQGERTSIPMPRVDRGGGQDSGVPGFPRQGGAPAQPSGSDDAKVFVAKVLKTTEDVWTDVFARYGQQYRPPKLVVFEGHVQTHCGTGMAAMGPFYCPLDQKVYIDLSFFNELKRRFRAPGDFAQAYVVGHEVGHHVQTLFGIADKVQQMKARLDQRQQNALQVRMELQADCLAGVWAVRAHKSRQILEPGDVEEALNAASAIGDDNIQRQTQGRVVPDAFTHGSAEQRVRWFRKGLETGDIQACDTFNSRDL